MRQHSEAKPGGLALPTAVDPKPEDPTAPDRIAMMNNATRSIAVGQESRARVEFAHVVRPLAAVHVNEQLICYAVQHRKEPWRTPAHISSGVDGLAVAQDGEQG